LWGGTGEEVAEEADDAPDLVIKEQFIVDTRRHGQFREFVRLCCWLRSNLQDLGEK
jgi:hypothetical protein